MKRMLGWLLIALGILVLFVVPAITKEVTGNYYSFIAVFIGFLIIGSGWVLVHPKKRLK